MKHFQVVSESLHQELGDHSDMKTLWSKTHEAEAVKKFVEAVTNVCWKMVIQRPPMEFRTSDKYEGERFQELTWNSVSSDTVNHVVVTVYPMLYHGITFMGKGKVLLLNPT